MEDNIKISIADESHVHLVETILDTIERAAKIRGTGIARRSPDYVKQKMIEGKVIIAIDMDDNDFAGFCYIESWGNKQFVANSGLIVVDKYRGHGLAKRIKTFSFEVSRQRFPEAKLFGLTTGLAVMKINNDLGYRPVPFSELTDDESFWKGCQTCINYDILKRTNRKMCLCTGMLYDPAEHKEGATKHEDTKTENK